MLDAVKNEVTKVLMTVRIQTTEQAELAAEEMEQRAARIANVTYTAPTETGEVESLVDDATAAAAQRRPMAGAMAAAVPRVGRNDPCPCAAARKYKHCHGHLS